MEIHTIKFVYAGDLEERETLHYLLNEILSYDDRYGSFFVEPKDMLDALKNYICDELEIDGDEYNCIPEFKELHELSARHAEVSTLYDDIGHDEINSAIELLIKLNEEGAQIKFYRE